MLYVNGEYRGNDDMGKLMEDFNNPEPESMNYEMIKMRSIYLKEDEKGVAGMCAFSEELLAKGEAKGKAEGKAEGVLQSVRNLMESYKLTAQAAMDALKVSAEERPAILAVL